MSFLLLLGFGVCGTTPVVDAVSAVSEQVLVNKVSFLFRKFDSDNDNFVSKDELRALMSKTKTDSDPLPKGEDTKGEDTYRNFCESLGASPEEGLTVSQLIEAYREGYGDVEADWMLLFEGRDGSEVLSCSLVNVDGVPPYQALLNGLYASQKIDSETGMPFFVKVGNDPANRRYLYWTKLYDGGWMLDDDFDSSSTNAFLSSPSGRIAGTWAVANGSAHWVDERTISVTCADDVEIEIDEDGNVDLGHEETNLEVIVPNRVVGAGGSQHHQQQQRQQGVRDSSDEDVQTLAFALDKGADKEAIFLVEGHSSMLERIMVDTRITLG